MNEVFETVAEVLEELRSEAEEREYSVHTNESENADKALKKANREYETVLAELSAEHREFFENYMDIVDHAHFQEEQRAYYQGMVDVMQIFDGLGILKERNKKAKYDVIRNEKNIYIAEADVEVNKEIDFILLICGNKIQII